MSRPWVCRLAAPHLCSQACRGTGHDHSCWPRGRTSCDRSQSQGARGRGRAGTMGLSPGGVSIVAVQAPGGSNTWMAWPLLQPLPTLPGQHSSLTVPACHGSEAGLAGAGQRVAPPSVPIAGTGLAAREDTAALEAAVTVVTSQACPAGAMPTHWVTGGAGGALGVGCRAVQEGALSAQPVPWAPRLPSAAAGPKPYVPGTQRSQARPVTLGWQGHCPPSRAHSAL